MPLGYRTRQRNATVSSVSNNGSACDTHHYGVNFAYERRTIDDCPRNRLRYSARMRAGPAGLQQRLHLVAAVSCLLACERSIERPGQVVVVLDTDMALPEQVDTLHVQVLTRGRVQFQN